ncbi:MAG: O-antigen ligase family protein [Lachnospiraceae bacterium]|nr:O-antigen ligase family protein [Lachnospiraceae bacterium]
MKINSSKLVNISCIFLLIYANYNTLINGVLSDTFRYIYIIGFTVIGLLAFLIFRFDVYKPERGILLAWLLLILEITLNRNYDLAEYSKFFYVRTVCGILIIFLSQCGGQWAKNSIKTITRIGSLNIVATFVFFIVPGLYSIMVDFYGMYPTGTDNGTAGYRAGLANHYSQNGTYISFVLLAIGAVWLFERTEIKKKKIMTSLLFFLSFVALVLTTKRAHFLFCVMTLCIVYFLANPKQIMGRTFKIIVAVFAAIGLLYIGSFFIQPIADLLSRFSTAGVDSESTSRLKMWALALQNFMQYPIFGIGWGRFKALYYANLYQSWQSEAFSYLNAHNVYIQLLCETGIVGLLIYLNAIISTLIFTVKALTKGKIVEDWKRKVLYMSIAFQVFIILYNFTGNSLYDYSIYFYSFAVAAGLSVIKLSKS